MECLGFSGTTSMASILEEQFDDIYVIHGSRNAVSRDKIGVNNQSPGEFVNSMLQINAETKKYVVALHCTFLPSKILPLCQKAYIDFKILVRNPEKQIMSCFSWAMKKVMLGDTEIPNQIREFQIEMSQFFRLNNIKNNIENKVYLWAARRVMAFNADAANENSQFCKMEDILGSNKSFCEAFNINKTMEKSFIQNKELNSHTSFLSQLKLKQKQFEFPECAKILSGIKVHFNSRRMNILNLSEQMGYEKPSIKIAPYNFFDIYSENHYS